MAAKKRAARKKRATSNKAAEPPRGLVARLLFGITEGGSRPMRGSRFVRTTLRAVHVVAVSAYYGGQVYDAEPSRLLPALIAVVASGSAFMLFEVLRAPIWLVQLRGLATYLKLGLLLAVHFYWEHRILLLTAVMVIGVVVSHMPGRLRYFSLLHRREMRGGEKG